jgi:ATP-dependent RNA helicase DeaD
MNVGRAANADPRWIIPIICRRGGISKREIGEIRIQDRETQFEIAASAAQDFAYKVSRRDVKDPEIRIAPLIDKPARGGEERPRRKPQPGGGAKPPKRKDRKAGVQG